MLLRVCQNHWRIENSLQVGLWIVTLVSCFGPTFCSCMSLIYHICMKTQNISIKKYNCFFCYLMNLNNSQQFWASSWSIQCHWNILNYVWQCKDVSKDTIYHFSKHTRMFRIVWIRIIHTFVHYWYDIHTINAYSYLHFSEWSHYVAISKYYYSHAPFLI